MQWRRYSPRSIRRVRDRLDMTGLLRRLLAAKSIAISTFGTDGQWGEIDNPGDVELYQSMIRDGELMLEAPLGADERGRGNLCKFRDQRLLRDEYGQNFTQSQLGLHRTRCALR